MKVDDTGVIEKLHGSLLKPPQEFVHNKKGRLCGLPFYFHLVINAFYSVRIVTKKLELPRLIKSMTLLFLIALVISRS